MTKVYYKIIRLKMKKIEAKKKLHTVHLLV